MNAPHYFRYHFSFYRFTFWTFRMRTQKFKILYSIYFFRKKMRFKLVNEYRKNPQIFSVSKKNLFYSSNKLALIILLHYRNEFAVRWLLVSVWIRCASLRVKLKCDENTIFRLISFSREMGKRAKGGYKRKTVQICMQKVTVS